MASRGKETQKCRYVKPKQERYFLISLSIRMIFFFFVRFELLLGLFFVFRYDLFVGVPLRSHSILLTFYKLTRGVFQRFPGKQDFTKNFLNECRSSRLGTFSLFRGKALSEHIYETCIM